ncbi:NXPE family member 3-like [Salvelinus namaycush]|uniref:NXPE family member 3-like n=1 Tax=Salvelinus namaycush TaxID=8040 RepID=A0A8U1BZM9_SALNM|nr:NXPE family member 3-like [Salvelinus namaycush]
MGTSDRETGPDHGRQKGGTVWKNLSKYTPIFLLLALSGIIFLLRNIHTLEKLNCQTVSTLYQFQSSIHSAFTPEEQPPLDHNRSYCGHLGLEPSAEEALEQRYLLESIAWPEPQPRLTPRPLRQTSDPAHSLFAILPRGGGREWRVGDQLEALVHMHDFQGRPKRHGGDFLLARLHSPELGAGVAGQVLDHRNGLYSAVFPLLWEGSVRVEVTLVHPSEAVAVLRRLREEHPDRVFFKSLFRSGFLSETTVCNLCLPTTRQPLCNYTDPHTGEPWYCYKPKLLSCDTRINHAKGGYQKHLLTNKESLLFQSGVNIKVRVHASGSDSVIVQPEKKDKPEMESSSVRAEPIRVTPSGYYFQGSWRALGGVAMHQFNDSSAITQCLKGKVVYMYGDSTARQWFEYLNAFVPELKEFNLHSPRNVGPFMAVDSTHNILLGYRCHGPPIRFSTVIASEMRYVANELDGLAGGPDTVVVLSVWAHFSTFPVEVYIRRLRHIRRAVVQLLDRAPGTLIVVRSANLQALDPEVSLYNSDWFSVQLDGVLRAMFRGLDVLLVDAWEMTLAHHLPHALHPPPVIVKNMIDTFLSYVCPEKS